jgi:sugar lactone lactonase YvrE
MLPRAVGCLWAACFLFQGQEEFKIERVASKLSYADSPLWSRESFLLYSDTPNNKIYKLTHGSDPSLFRADSQGATGMTFDAQGRLYVCETGARRVTRTDKKGQTEVLAHAWQGKKLNAPNDIVVRKDGHVYFTDPAFGKQLDSRELDYYGIYHINPKGEVSVAAKWKSRPNGIALSPNGRTLYVSDSDERTVRAFDIEKDGAPVNERVLISGIAGIPDGIRTDERGNLYVAAKEVYVYSSAGKQISHINLGETPSNLAWGDNDFGTLYVSARSSVYRIRLDTKGSVQY